MDDYKKTVGAAFDEAAEGYDGAALRFFDHAAAHLVNVVDIAGDENILDVCTGTGKVALKAAQKLKSGHVTAVDLSQQMLKRARLKAAENGIRNIHFELGDIDRLLFGGRLFDGLFCSFGVHFWEHMERSMAHLLKWLKPGAFVAMSSFAKGSFEPQSTATLKRFTQYGIKLPATYTWEKLDSEAKNVALFERLGLRSIRQERAQMGHSLSSADDWWDLVRFTGFRAFLNKMNESQIDAFKRENLAEIQQMADGDPILLNVDVIFTCAKVP